MSQHLRLTEQQLAALKQRHAVGVIETEKPRKYRNQPTVVDGIEFHSRKEAKRWNELRLLESTGRIEGLQRQVRYEIQVGVWSICEYVADFVYRKDGAFVIEDVKGYRGGSAYDAFRLKARLMQACYGIEVTEV